MSCDGEEAWALVSLLASLFVVEIGRVGERLSSARGKFSGTD